MLFEDENILKTCNLGDSGILILRPIPNSEDKVEKIYRS